MPRPELSACLGRVAPTRTGATRPADTRGTQVPASPDALDELAAQVKFVGLHAVRVGDRVDVSFARGAIDRTPVRAAGDGFVIGEDRTPAANLPDAIEALVQLIAPPVSDYMRKQIDQIRQLRYPHSLDGA